MIVKTKYPRHYNQAEIARHYTQAQNEFGPNNLPYSHPSKWDFRNLSVLLSDPRLLPMPLRMKDPVVEFLACGLLA